MAELKIEGMAKSLRAQIFSLPPIDWAALAQKKRDACRWTKKGDKRTPAEIAKMQAARKANAEARMRAAVERKRAERTAARKEVVGPAARIVDVMAPGEWYARTDLRQLLGLTKRTVDGCVSTLERRGVVERAMNEEAQPARYAKGVPVDLQSDRHATPVVLFRLTGAGVERQRKARHDAGHRVTGSSGDLHSEVKPDVAHDPHCQADADHQGH